MEPKPQAEPHLTSWSDFRRSVLKIIAELSPCSEPTLFIIAAHRGLQRLGDGSLDDLNKLLGRCVRELRARGLLEISGEQLVITAAGRALDEDILEIAAEVELHPSLRPSKQDEASTKQTQLQTQAQVMSGPKRAGEPKREELIAASAGSAEEEDILDLTPELEIRPSLRSSQRDEARINRTQRAREPTREEIIAAMRKFISDE